MYFPKNKIKTNQYTKGGEYQFDIGDPDLDLEYVGFYYKLYTGEIYSGKNPDDPTTELLIPIYGDNTITTQTSPPEVTELALPLGDADFSSNSSDYGDEGDGSIISGGGIGEYLSLIQTNSPTNPRNPKFIPPQYYPKPTEDDYKVGNFKRYFCVKVNENSHIELDKKTYDKLSSKNSNWAYELYIPFTLTWYITGEESQVESTNKNLVLIQEQRSKRRGLKEFLRENYTKFYKPQ